MIPGSEGMREPTLSPDGKFLAAVSEDLHRLMLFEVAIRKWTELSRGTLYNGSLAWSRDGKYLYFQDLVAPNEPLCRLRMTDRQRDQVTNFESYIRSGVPRCFFVGLAPDESFVIALLRNHADVYTLEMSFQ